MCESEFDAMSAFNNMTRRPMMEELQRAAPGLVSWFGEWTSRESCLAYRVRDGKVRWIHTTKGVDQRAPGSPALFALGLARAIRQAKGAPGCRDGGRNPAGYCHI